jgi:hypothetical protein
MGWKKHDVIALAVTCCRRFTAVGLSISVPAAFAAGKDLSPHCGWQS